MNYNATLDTKAIVTTSVITAVFACLIFTGFVFITDNGKGGPIYTQVLLVLTYGIAYAFSPLSYSITETELIVRRPLISVYIDLVEIKSAQLIDRTSFGGSIRTAGVGGLFGYYGTFRNFTIGKMQWYATRTDYAVLIIKTSGEKILMTPDNPKGFIMTLKKSLDEIRPFLRSEKT